jgi:hypothetical protein
MQDKSLAESVRSRLALGQPVRVGGPGVDITVQLSNEDMLTDVIFALGTQLGDERPWKFEITERGMSTKVASIDEVLRYLDGKGPLTLR